MTFSYVDYQFVKRTVQDTEYSTGLIQNLGGAGRVVNKVFTGTQIRDDGYQSLLQQYVAEGPITGALSVGQVTTNLKYNDTFLYPIDVTNNARHFHNVFSAEGRVPPRRRLSQDRLTLRDTLARMVSSLTSSTPPIGLTLGSGSILGELSCMILA